MTTKKLLLFFPECETERSIVYKLVKEYNLIVNIFRAKVTPEEEGYLVLDVSGKESNIQNAIKYIKTLNVKVNEKDKGMIWDSSKCSGCGNCIPHCPTGALYIANRETMRVDFKSSLCVECLRCIDICPYKACSSLF